MTENEIMESVTRDMAKEPCTVREAVSLGEINKAVDMVGMGDEQDADAWRSEIGLIVQCNDWDKLKSQGQSHYKTGSTEPVDLYRAGNMFQDWALCNIIKLAFRNRRELGGNMSVVDLDEIIDYAMKLKAVKLAEVQE